MIVKFNKNKMKMKINMVDEDNDDEKDDDIFILKNKPTTWQKTQPSKQDLINKDINQIKNKLSDYQLIPQHKYESIEIGTYIRYVRFVGNKPEIRLGGILIKNGYPNYWVLKNAKKGSSIKWSVQLKPKRNQFPNKYFAKKDSLNSREEKTKFGREVYDALKNGKYMLVPTKTLELLTSQVLEQNTRQTHAQYILEED